MAYPTRSGAELRDGVHDLGLAAAIVHQHLRDVRESSRMRLAELECGSREVRVRTTAGARP